ncbi:conjugal transfer protein TrbL [Stenotrophomonas indicatrix]|uniref:conjugal transfer protein TrbL n=1 Tax=Stenotrophomonas indicatrix TaxID=2045451 RepID=UPI00215B4668|nr:conjugal transfer protein TrbL [Stenotrophomonas indicatrix]MCR8715684.1 conjugal transfer protein TrbL [Stenotrophomonas indicatrix]
MFSMGVLAAMFSIAIDMVIRVSAAFWTSALVDKYLLDPEGSVDMTSQAMQQGGMGLILTTLILTVPPMAAMFFQGTLGGFMAYSQIGGGAAGTPSSDGRPAGSYTPPAPAKTEAQSSTVETNQMVRSSSSQGSSPNPGLAPDHLGAARNK